MHVSSRFSLDVALPMKENKFTRAWVISGLVLLSRSIWKKWRDAREELESGYYYSVMRVSHTS